MSASSITCRGWPFELHLDDDAPEREDRAPRAGRVDDLRRPRPGGHDDRPGGHEAVRGLDPGRPGPLPRHMRRDAFPDRGAALGGEGGEPEARRCRRDREPDAEPHRRETVGEAGLEAPEVVRADEGRVEVGVGGPDRGRLRAQQRLVPAHGQDPGRLVVEPEAAARSVLGQLRLDLVGERPVALERLAIQGAEHGVGRVPDRAGVAAGGARRDRPPLVERDPGSAPGQLGRERRPDDPGTDDRDVGRRLPVHGAERQAAGAPAAMSRSSSTSRSTSPAVL